ncbi:hypothetical protein KR032_007111 [Drosophila birchii]|nr:hypothetical protein KR032_007111 [Drosophila birchii]
MAEVEKPTATPPTDIPLATPPSASELESPTTDVAGADVEPGTSPTQEPNSNSHPHDSEYDTASDLEGGEDYDDEESGSGSASGSGSEEETETDDEDEDVGSETDDGEADHAQDRSIADSEAQKKVDEDRSNPQYIPKRGTFYEHDDRTAETEGDVLVEPENGAGQVPPEPNGELNGLAAAGATPAGQTPQISQASKTMRKWQPASGGDRWSHDRFEASEQAPKSRAELLQAYGYDIRNEDAPPRARRRRRYTRGPSKYSRNWEDEQAYLKASNKERKPPRPQDFPALNERKPRGPRTSSSREEKENRRTGGAGGVGVEKQQGMASSSNPNRSQERERERDREREREREREPKNRNFGRMNGGPGRQNAMEFKKSGRGQQPRDREREREQPDNRNQKQSTPRSNQQHPQQQQPQQQPQQQRQPTQQPQTPLSTTNLSQRLQQVQQRNDPSHVGSVQMHSLANQSPQQPPQPLHQEQRNAPKRYSSLRRSQQEATQHLAEQQMQQQLHLQQQQPQPSQIMIQDPHVLMQIAYQQQELQAQLQTMQLGPTATGAVAAPPKPHAPPAAAYPQAQAAPYYVTGTEPVPVPVPVPVAQAPYVNPASAAYLPTTPAAVAYAQAAPPVVPQPTPAPAQAPSAAQPAQPYQNYNTVGGTTYFVPPAQTANRPAALPQRRPTNAIPILPPSEKHKTKGGAPGAGGKEEGNSDNIDHIIDNMFVARPSAFQATGEGAAAGGGATKEDAATPPAAEQNLQPVAATGKE